MKFLVIQRVRPHTPIDALAKLTPAQLKYFEELERQGKIEKYYHLIGQQGHMIIADTQSDEELTRIIGDDPLFFYSEREVYPLTTLKAHTKHVSEILRG